MKKLDKYIISQFFIAFLGSLIIMLGLYIITICIDNLKYFSNPKVPFEIVIIFIVNKVPGILIQILPVATLFSCAFIFGNLNVNNEIIAIYNGRIQFARLVVPLLIIGLFISIFSFLFFEFVSADCSYKAYNIRTRIKRLTGKNLYYMYVHSEFFFLGEDNTYYYLEMFDSENGIMLRPALFRFDNDNILEFQLNAELGKYDKNKSVWNFSDGMIIQFDNGGKLTREEFSSYALKLPESPGSFLKITKTFMQMRLKDVLNIIDAKKKVGGDYKKYLVEFHWRFAYPFAIIIVILIGSVAGSYINRAVIVLSFFVSIIISFGFYGMLALGLAFGKAGRLSPFVAAWLANVICIGAGIIILRMKK